MARISQGRPAAVAGKSCSSHGSVLQAAHLEELKISPREAEVVALVIEGLANKEIAHRLSIAPATVKDHIYRTYQKTGVTNRVQLVNLFCRRIDGRHRISPQSHPHRIYSPSVTMRRPRHARLP
ncbi:MAG: LuxR C-terminal-related transcriptional regulator [Holophagales bacterium]|nr:LuxR C-terminal-related transcriptional regulator [Holophagales bacterium]